MKRIFTVCACATMLCSCYTSRILVGDVTPKEPMVEVAKKHDAHFIGGLVKTAKNVAEEHVGTAQNYMIRSQYGFGDIVLSAITVGIYTPTTTKYYLPVRYLEGFEPVKPKERPDKANGLMLMTGVNGIAAAKKGGITIDVVAGYKFMDHFIAGVGVNSGIGPRYLRVTKGEEKNNGEKQGWNTLFDVVLRGRYLLYDKPNTPYANLDIGVALSNESLAYSSSDLKGSYHRNWSSWVGTSCVITPSIGYQYKVRKNVYLDAAFGYRIDTGLKFNGYTYNYEDQKRHEAKARVYSGGFLLKFGVNFML